MQDELFPRVIWQGQTSDGEFRMVQSSATKCTPEKRGVDDAMGNQSWTFTQWGGKWQEALVQEFVKLKMGEGGDMAP